MDRHWNWEWEVTYSSQWTAAAQHRNHFTVVCYWEDSVVVGVQQFYMCLIHMSSILWQITRTVYIKCNYLYIYSTSISSLVWWGMYCRCLDVPPLNTNRIYCHIDKLSGKHFRKLSPQQLNETSEPYITEPKCTSAVTCKEHMKPHLPHLTVASPQDRSNA